MPYVWGLAKDATGNFYFFTPERLARSTRELELDLVTFLRPGDPLVFLSVEPSWACEVFWGDKVLRDAFEEDDAPLVNSQDVAARTGSAGDGSAGGVSGGSGGRGRFKRRRSQVPVAAGGA